MKDEIKKILQVLRKGGVILYPADTKWGIGCDATNDAAVAKLYEIRKSAEIESVEVLLDEADFLHSYMEKAPEVAFNLIEMSEKPTLIIYDDAQRLAENLIRKDGSVGIRITTDKFCKTLIDKLSKPIVLTDATVFGKAKPQNFNEISKEIKESVDYIVNWRQDEKIKPKQISIIKLGSGGQIEIIKK